MNQLVQAARRMKATLDELSLKLRALLRKRITGQDEQVPAKVVVKRQPVVARRRRKF